MNGCCKAANQARGDDEVGLKAGRVDPIGQVLWPLPPPPLRTSRRHRRHQWVQTFSFFIIQWISHFFFWNEFLFHILRCLLHLTRFVSSVSVFIVLLVQRQYDISRVRTVFRHHGRVGLCKTYTHNALCAYCEFILNCRSLGCVAAAHKSHYALSSAHRRIPALLLSF